VATDGVTAENRAERLRSSLVYLQAHAIDVDHTVRFKVKTVETMEQASILCYLSV
jgi:hypothetical protein